MQEKAANAAISLSKCVRTVMGPSGTVVTFPEDMGLPSIFDPKPSRYDNQPREILALVCNGIDFIFWWPENLLVFVNSYPPPRESCAGPSCTNPYKYRDSKTNLPLCSLKCYKAIHEKVPAEIAGWEWVLEHNDTYIVHNLIVIRSRRENSSEVNIKYWINIEFLCWLKKHRRLYTWV